MALLIELFRIFYLIFLGYTIVSLTEILIVHLFRKFAPVHTHNWAFAISMLSKIFESMLGFCVLSQCVAFFVVELQTNIEETWLKYLLMAIFTLLWVAHIELHRGREENFLALEGVNYIKFDFDRYYIILVKLSMVVEVLGSLIYVYYLSNYPRILGKFLSPIFARLVFF